MNNTWIKRIAALTLSCGMLSGVSVPAAAADTATAPLIAASKIVPAATIGVSAVDSTPGTSPATVGASGTEESWATVKTEDAEEGYEGYRILFDGLSAVIYRDGERIVSYDLRSSDVSFSTEAGGEVIMKFIGGSGKTTAASIGAQTRFVIDGNPSSVTFEKTFSKDVAVTFTEDSSVTSVLMNAGNKVDMNGRAVYVQIDGSAKVSVRETASIGTLTVNGARARVETVDGAIGKTNVPAADILSIVPAEDQAVITSYTEAVEYESVTPVTDFVATSAK